MVLNSRKKIWKAKEVHGSSRSDRVLVRDEGKWRRERSGPGILNILGQMMNNIHILSTLTEQH